METTAVQEGRMAGAAEVEAEERKGPAQAAEETDSGVSYPFFSTLLLLEGCVWFLFSFVRRVL